MSPHQNFPYRYRWLLLACLVIAFVALTMRIINGELMQPDGGLLLWIALLAFPLQAWFTYTLFRPNRLGTDKQNRK
jgi:hypothetical protein